MKQGVYIALYCLIFVYHMTHPISSNDCFMSYLLYDFFFVAPILLIIIYSLITYKYENVFYATRNGYRNETLHLKELFMQTCQVCSFQYLCLMVVNIPTNAREWEGAFFWYVMSLLVFLLFLLTFYLVFMMTQRTLYALGAYILIISIHYFAVLLSHKIYYVSFSRTAIFAFDNLSYCLMIAGALIIECFLFLMIRKKDSIDSQYFPYLGFAVIQGLCFLGNKTYLGDDLLKMPPLVVGTSFHVITYLLLIAPILLVYFFSLNIFMQYEKQHLVFYLTRSHHILKWYLKQCKAVSKQIMMILIIKCLLSLLILRHLHLAMMLSLLYEYLFLMTLILLTSCLCLMFEEQGLSYLTITLFMILTILSARDVLSLSFFHLSYQFWSGLILCLLILLFSLFYCFLLTHKDY